MLLLTRQLVELVRGIYPGQERISLHEPRFDGNDRRYVVEAIDSTFVSSVGAYVDRFEHDVATYTGARRAVATTNGTSALHVALQLAGVRSGDLVITQSLTFVATCNAIAYCNAIPFFADVETGTLSLAPAALAACLEACTERRGGDCVHRESGRRIAAVLPMHTFGHPADLAGLLEVCAAWQLPLVEDAAESLGSRYRGRHTGTFGLFGTLSFNGNKIITTGGGGMILTNDESLGQRAKHLTTTAKRPHQWAFDHDEIGYNYRLPNLNAALGCAQLERIEAFVAAKRRIADIYAGFLSRTDCRFVKEPEGCRANYWLNAAICPSAAMRDRLLHETNAAGVMTRPAWRLMHRLPMFEAAPRGDLSQSEWLAERLINLPSSVPAGGGSQ